MKVLLGTLKLEKALVQAFSVVVKSSRTFVCSSRNQKPDGEAETINSLHSLFRRSQFNRIKIKRDAENYTKLCLESFLSVRFPAISCHSTFDKQFAKLQM